MSNCMYTTQGEFVCNNNKENEQIIERFAKAPKSSSSSSKPSLLTSFFNLFTAKSAANAIKSNPEGLYKNNCTSCNIRYSYMYMGNYLHCTCKNNKGEDKKTDIRISKCNSISDCKNCMKNVDGKLACGKN